MCGGILPAKQKAVPVILDGGSTCWYEVVIYGRKRGRQASMLLRGAREAEERGAGEILLTSMETDGTKNGFDIAITFSNFPTLRGSTGYRERGRRNPRPFL